MTGTSVYGVWVMSSLDQIHYNGNARLRQEQVEDSFQVTTMSERADVDMCVYTVLWEKEILQSYFTSQ